MQKKSKSRKRPFRKKSKKHNIRKPTNSITNVPKSNVGKGVWAADAPVEYDSPKHIRSLFNPAYLNQLLGIPFLKTRMEFYCQSNVNIQSMDEIYAESYRQAVLIVRHKKEEAEEKYTSIFDTLLNFKISISNIERIILKEQDANNWFTTYTYIDDQNVEQFTDVKFRDDAGHELSTTDLNNAINTIIDTLADLMAKYGNDNPECGIQQRLFKFAEVLFVVPLDEYKQMKDDLQTNKYPLIPLEEIDKAFQETKKDLGDGFTSRDAQKLDFEKMSVLHTLMVHAAEYGEWKWPFTKSNG